MMLKIKALFAVVLCIFAFASCKKEAYDADVQLKVDDKLITDFLARNTSIKATKHSSGIYYEIINEGTGASATPSSKITANYEGRLLDGTVFDKTTTTPLEFMLGQVITGWKIGVPLVKKGGTIRLIIPSVYAYQNSSPSSLIPANSVLDFTIEVVNVQ